MYRIDNNFLRLKVAGRQVAGQCGSSTSRARADSPDLPESSDPRASASRWSHGAQPAGREQNDEADAENQAVGDEDAGGVTLEEADQEGDGEVAEDEGGGGGGGDVDHVVRRGQKVMTNVVEFEHSGGEDRGEREQEGESRGGFAVEVAEEAAGDGDAGARRAGNERHRLREADDDGVRPGDLPDRFASASVAGAVGGVLFSHDEHERENDHRGGDDVKRAQNGFDLMLEEQAEDDDWHGADGDHPARPRFVRRERFALEEAGDDRAADRNNVLYEIDHHRQQRADLDDRRESRAGILDPHEFRDDAQVRGAADGQEFGESLHDAENDGLDEGHWRWLLRLLEAALREELADAPGRRHDGASTVADAVFLVDGELGEGALHPFRREDRVVAEAAVALPLGGDDAVDVAVGGIVNGHRAALRHGQSALHGDDRAEAGRAFALAAHLCEQVAHVIRVGARRPFRHGRVAGRVDARCAIERSDFEAGVVGERDEPVEARRDQLENRLRFQPRIAFERRLGLLDLDVKAEVMERVDADARSETFEHRFQFANLVLVARGEDDGDFRVFRFHICYRLMRSRIS